MAIGISANVSVSGQGMSSIFVSGKLVFVMIPRFPTFGFLPAILFLFAGAIQPAHAQVQKQIFVHYMPWYSSKPISGHWGWHWTMNKFNPDAERAEVASHYFPSIGPYDSNDPFVIEYHVQLMKLSGLSGVIIDWYGVSDFRDYATIHRNTQSLIKVIKQAGLKFAICYEDQTLKHRLAHKNIRPDQVLKSAIADFRWLETECFSDSAYVKVDNRPLLLVFGPQHLQLESWKQLTRKSNPMVLGLPHLNRSVRFPGAFGWPPVHGGKTVLETQWTKYLQELDARSSNEPTMTVAFPGFKDIYQQAGVGTSYGFIDDNGGKTFEKTLDMAFKSNSRLIQIATWNDFGEGTNIEPTTQYKTSFLQRIQERTKEFHPYKPGDLEYPLMIYNLRKSNRDRKSTRKLLDEHSNNLLKGNVSKVRSGFPLDQ